MGTIRASTLGHLTLGARLLSNGGGGSPEQSRLVAEELIERHGPIPLVDVEDLPDDSLVIAVAALGAPAVIDEKVLGVAPFVHAVQTLADHLDTRIGAIMPLSVGGMTLLTPIFVAASLGLPVLDANGTGRALPQIEMTTMTLHGLAAAPMVVTDEHGNHVIVGSRNNAVSERLVRSATMHLGLSTALACYPMTGQQAQRGTIRRSVSCAIRVGSAVQELLDSPDNWDDFLARTSARSIIDGHVIDVTRKATVGFARSTIIVEAFDGIGDVVRLEAQNEILLAIRNGRVVQSPPGSVCILDFDSGEPLLTDRLQQGARVRIVAFEAAAEWDRPGAAELVGPAAFGYPLPAVTDGMQRS